MKRFIQLRLWGLLRLILILASTPGYSQDDTTVAKSLWYFDNFDEPNDLTWETFRQTFIGIAPTEAECGDFDRLFYQLIFKDKLAKAGHCYGMCVMGLLLQKNGGYMGYCYPPSQYPAIAPNPPDTTVGPIDTNLRHVIQLVHGNQISRRSMMLYLDAVAKNVSRNGVYAYEQVNYYLAKDDPVVLSVSTGILPGEGHVLVPYRTEDLGTTLRIYIYDPNRSYYESGMSGKAYYAMDSNYVEINRSSKHWKFKMSSGKIWEGDPSSGGNLIAIPLSVAGVRDRLPTALFADAADALNKIIILGDGELEQLTDQDGRQYLKPGTQEIQTNPVLGLTNVWPFIPLSGENTGPQVFFWRGGSPVTINVKSKTGIYELVWLSDHSAVRLAANGLVGSNSLKLAEANTAFPQVAIQHTGKSSLELWSDGGKVGTFRKYQLENFTLQPQQMLTVKLTDQARQVVTHINQGKINFNLRIQERTGGNLIIDRAPARRTKRTKPTPRPVLINLVNKRIEQNANIVPLMPD